MMQSDEMIEREPRISECVLLYWLCLCSLGGGNITASLLPSPFQTEFVVACAWLLYGLLVAPCGFVCDIV